jgi:hypothetical protein
MFGRDLGRRDPRRDPAVSICVLDVVHVEIYATEKTEWFVTPIGYKSCPSAYSVLAGMAELTYCVIRLKGQQALATGLILEIH